MVAFIWLQFHVLTCRHKWHTPKKLKMIRVTSSFADGSVNFNRIGPAEDQTQKVNFEYCDPVNFYVLPGLRGGKEATMLSKWVSVTMEPKPTTNSADFDLILPDLNPSCFGTSSLVQCLLRKASNGLECYSELARDHTRYHRFAMCSQSCHRVSEFFLLFLRNELNQFRCKNQAQPSNSYL